MELIVPILLNCLLVFGVYFADKHGVTQKWSYTIKQIVVGVLFGGASAFASSFGVEWQGTIVNVRDAAPLSAGLIFGAPAGIIAGCIGGLYRWFSVYWGAGTYTRLACSLATVFAGFMAAGVRKRMFDDKKPNFIYGFCIAIACEVVHMLLIFITNMDDSSYAFKFVQGATIPMLIGNGIAVGFSLFIVSLFGRDRTKKRKKVERIANTFQRWLLICIAIAFLATSVFTYILQNEIVKVETREVFTTAMNDVETAVKEKSNAELLDIAKSVKEEYEENADIALSDLAEKYQVVEINLVNKDGIITQSTDPQAVDYDMNSKAQSKEFIEVLKEKEYFVQDYGPRGEDESIWRKYAGINLDKGGFIQVGYDAKQFHVTMETFVIDVTKNRHVGTGGFVAVCDESLRLVIDNEYKNKPISSIGIKPSAEMLKGKTATKLYTADIVDGISANSAKYLYVFKFVE